MKILTNKRVKTFFDSMLISIMVFIFLFIILIGFEIKNSVYYIFIFALLMWFIIFAAWYKYFYLQSKIIENAEQKITAYMLGDKNARIDCDSEGEMYRLFHEINSLVTTLNAHAENELQSKEFLKNTISDISHQLKTPLTALNIYNGLLQDESKNLPEIQKFSDCFEQELDRMERLVQNLLKITKIDAKTITFNKTVQNTAEMMSCVQKHFIFRAEKEEKEFKISGNSDITLLCDRDWFIEAMDNIVKNAFDHTTKGDIISIEWRKFASIVQIIIKDNGCGIYPEDLPHIFKRFYRSRFSKDTQGIGLGLALSKSIIEAHNGTIEVDSELNKGTTFTVNFLIPTKL